MSKPKTRRGTEVELNLAKTNLQEGSCDGKGRALSNKVIFSNYISLYQWSLKLTKDDVKQSVAMKLLWKHFFAQCCSFKV